MSALDHTGGISKGRWFWLLLLSLLFLHFFVFVQLPVSIYLESEALDNATLPAVVMALLVLALLSLLCLLAVLGILGWPVRKLLGPVLLALALTYWLIDSFLGRSYPNLDGAITELPLDATHGWRQLLVFILVLLTLLLSKRRLELPIMAFLAMLTLLNAFWVARALWQLPPPAIRGEQDISASEFFTLSREQNVLLVLMDTFQSEYLEEVLAAKPELREGLQGFSYFPDTLGVATSTFMSIPAIHSGQPYEPSRTMSAYFNESIRHESLLSRLGQAGYQSMLLNPIRRVCPDNAGCLGRDELLRSRLQSHLGVALRLLDISLMRSVPEPWKNAVLNEGNFLLTPLYSPNSLGGDALVVWDDSRVLADFPERLRLVDERPHAVFMHLMNTHPPYVLDQLCQVIVLEDHNTDSRASALQQASCGITQFIALLNALQAQGIYDQTMIVLLGDHGSSSAYADPSLVSRRLQADATTPEFAARLVGSANPLLMIKPFGASGPLQTSPRHADLTDIPATVCAALPVCDWPVGFDLFAAEPLLPRKRNFMNYRWEHSFWEKGSIPELEFYTVAGPISSWKSWQLEAGLHRKSLLQLQLSDADDPGFFGEGWGQPEVSPQGTGMRWVDGHRAELLLLLQTEEEADNMFQLNVGLWVPDFNPGQAVSLDLNGHTYPKQALEPGLHTVKFRIPAGQMHSGINQMVLGFDVAQRPNEEDHRKLAVVVNALHVEKIEVGR